MTKKILVVDDSALMRRVLCDIINEDSRYEVEDTAGNGLEALQYITSKKYDAIVLDVNMPKMTGIELLRELQKRSISAKILMASTDTKDGASVTLEALELGALDFVQKPGSFLVAQNESFRVAFLRALEAVVTSNLPIIYEHEQPKQKAITNVVVEGNKDLLKKRFVVAIASSTGGPKALQQVLAMLPTNVNAPIVIVQHMPAGFTKSFADRLDATCGISIHEAMEGDLLEDGHVYISKGGEHLRVVKSGNEHFIHYTDEPAREGVKPSANYMYESLVDSGFEEVICVVLTGMGADGTQGIVHLNERKKTYVIAQNEETSTVYGMPRSIVKTGLTKKIVPIEQVAQMIITNVGVK